MKKLLVNLLYCMSFIGIISCSTTQSIEPVVSENSINKELVREVKQLDKIYRKLGYSKLNSNEKAFFWKEQIKEFVSSSSLTSKQKQLLDEALLHLTSAGFEGGKETEDLRNFTKKWIQNAEQYFDKNTLRVILTGYKPDEKIAVLEDDGEPSAGGEEEDGRKDCDCNEYHDNKYYGCGSPAEKSCISASTAKCKTTSWIGCGAWMLQACNGMCGNTPLF